MSAHEMTAEEFLDSLTGFDEMAIKKAFGDTITNLSSNDQMMFARALVFIAKRREGLADGPAKNAALEMTFGEVTRYFAEDVETTPEEPETESGKGGLPLGPTLTSSPASAS